MDERSRTGAPGRGPAPVVAVEGVDGAGKDTLTTALAERLGRRGLTVGRLAFPRYGHRHADLAADALHGRVAGIADSPQAMAVLFALDRAEAAEELDSLRGSCDVVLLDRYCASNAAYTAARLRPDPEVVAEVFRWVDELEFGRLGLPRPALQVLLDTDVDEAARRAGHRESTDATRTRDRYERDADLQTATSAAYRVLAERTWASPWSVADGATADGGADRLAELVADLVAGTPGEHLGTTAPSR